MTTHVAAQGLEMRRCHLVLVSAAAGLTAHDRVQAAGCARQSLSAAQDAQAVFFRHSAWTLRAPRALGNVLSDEVHPHAVPEALVVAALPLLEEYTSYHHVRQPRSGSCSGTVCHRFPASTSAGSQHVDSHLAWQAMCGTTLSSSTPS